MDTHNTPILSSVADERLDAYTQAVEAIMDGDYDIEIPVQPLDKVGRLGSALQHLADDIENVYLQNRQFDQITQHINSGLLLDDILNYVYDAFRELIPYQRIGFSLIESEGPQRMVRARWAKSDLPHVRLNVGYAAPLEGSSLEDILRTGQPRIINDLQHYAEHKPQSQSTQLILSEGLRSSLTCPLIVNGIPSGFMFFSSTQLGTYDHVHVDVFTRIAGQLSIILEKGVFVSEIVKQRAEIERQNDELRRLSELKNTFLGMAAHDLRNPLGNIRLAAELLTHEEYALPADTQQELLGDVSRQVNYMLDLLNDLLDVSQIESGKLQLNCTSVELASFLQQAVDRHTQLATPKETIVELIQCSTGCALADPLRLRQVIDNLISNAVKFSPLKSRIRVQATCLGTHWRITVRDEGPGISPEDRQRLFQDFARLSAQPTQGEKSTGLGLSITRRIIEAHNGKIGVDSEPGHGATFWFTLPTA